VECEWVLDRVRESFCEVSMFLFVIFVICGRLY
jgi:hypothetical protein